MSSNLRSCLPLLETLSKLKDPKKRLTFLKLFEDNMMRAMREISYNLLNGNVQLSEGEKKKLKKYKKVLRLLASNKTRKLRFRRAVSQTGRGFLPALIPLIATAIANLV